MCSYTQSTLISLIDYFVHNHEIKLPFLFFLSPACTCPLSLFTHPWKNGSEMKFMWWYSNPEGKEISFLTKPNHTWMRMTMKAKLHLKYHHHHQGGKVAWAILLDVTFCFYLDEKQIFLLSSCQGIDEENIYFFRCVPLMVLILPDVTTYIKCCFPDYYAFHSRLHNLVRT